MPSGLSSVAAIVVPSAEQPTARTAAAAAPATFAPVGSNEADGAVLLQLDMTIEEVDANAAHMAIVTALAQYFAVDARSVNNVFITM